MAWEDKTLYWAWRGEGSSACCTPTNKRLEYAKVSYENGIVMKICCGVFDNEKYTPLHRTEIAWHESQGAKIEF